MTKNLQWIKQGEDGFTIRWWTKDCLVLHPRYLADLKEADAGEISYLRNLSDVGIFTFSPVGAGC